MRRRRNPDSSSSSRDPMLSSAELIAAAKAVIAVANRGGVQAAICGGYAMQLFGSDRMTNDLDFIASDRLPTANFDTLTFGGFKYRIKGVKIDWIVRDDEQEAVYQTALRERTRLKNGLPIIRPEWMALIKLLARRTKDHSDLMYLLRAPRLVNRKNLKSIVRELFDTNAFIVIDDLENRFLEADMGSAWDNRHNS
jgi:hypothetical protein